MQCFGCSKVRMSYYNNLKTGRRKQTERNPSGVIQAKIKYSILKMFIYPLEDFPVCHYPLFSCNLILTCSVIQVNFFWEQLSTTRLLLLACEQLLGNEWGLINVSCRERRKYFLFRFSSQTARWSRSEMASKWNGFIESVERQV